MVSGSPAQDWQLLHSIFPYLIDEIPIPFPDEKSETQTHQMAFQMFTRVPSQIHQSLPQKRTAFVAIVRKIGNTCV